MSGLAASLVMRASNLLNAVLPAEKRDALSNALQSFARTNPKLAVFLLANTILTGIPLLCFIGFTLTVLVFSLVATLLAATVIALVFTASMVFVASLFLFPTVFFTTISACFLFAWAVGGFYIFAYLQHAGFAPPNEVIDDKVNTWTGGRVSWPMKRSSIQKERPKVETKDSAVGLESLEILGEVEEFRQPAMSFDSQSTVVGQERPSSAEAEPPEEAKASPTGAGLPTTYAKLRKAHPDGLRVDRNGLFKCDDIASNSSLEDTRDRTQASVSSSQRTVQARSGNTSTAIHSPLSPETAIYSPIDEPVSPKTGLEVPHETEEPYPHRLRSHETNAHADVEDNDQSNPSSGKSSAELERMMAKSTSAVENVS